MWSNLTCEASLLPVRTFEEFGIKLKQHFIFRNVEKFLLLAEIYEEQEGISVECQLPASQQYVLSSQQVWAFQGGRLGPVQGEGAHSQGLVQKVVGPLSPLWTERMTDRTESITIATPLAGGKNTGESI